MAERSTRRQRRQKRWQRHAYKEDTREADGDPSERRPLGQRRKEEKEKKKTLRYGYAPQAGAAVNNETLHQLAKILAVFSLREVELSRRIQRFLTQQRGRALLWHLRARASLVPPHRFVPPTLLRPLQFPATHSFFIVHFFAPRFRRHLGRIERKQ